MHILPEIDQQLVHIDKVIGEFPVTDMAVIAFARLVVLAQYARIILDEGQSIFVAMTAPPGWSRQNPDDKLRSGSRPNLKLIVHMRIGLHVGIYSNTSA